MDISVVSSESSDFVISDETFTKKKKQLQYSDSDWDQSEEDELASPRRNRKCRNCEEDLGSKKKDKAHVCHCIDCGQEFHHTHVCDDMLDEYGYPSIEGNQFGNWREQDAEQDAYQFEGEESEGSLMDANAADASADAGSIEEFMIPSEALEGTRPGSIEENAAFVYKHGCTPDFYLASNPTNSSSTYCNVIAHEAKAEIMRREAKGENRQQHPSDNTPQHHSNVALCNQSFEKFCEIATDKTLCFKDCIDIDAHLDMSNAVVRETHEELTKKAEWLHQLTQSGDAADGRF